ncbi:TetR/AcrR family transcriptional regulator [Microbispora sp. ATCC PTA-5024]|uniref:TetR/AcrR family transcriptional regulator n=1 Tax=Microbispora sp. ATCC PTA-5024 TaxID=316330 RepID=UPI0003DC4338|nr:TetR/AcrR family transcriptional regulator [Microbispora sp. ATCC PTA-5024]ETK37838.1 TetR family transcriptional regulator [Microbispora sp. ATCC PTA-5024]
MAEGRPLRADARRNRARILEAAEAVFAAQGVSASTEDVARRAGVGIGTVFRHFPTKESLVEEVFLGRVRMLADKAAALSEADAGTAFFRFFAYAVEQAATQSAYADVLAEAAATGGEEGAAPSAVGRELAAALAELLGRAQRAGAVRADMGVEELVALLIGASRAAEHVGPEVRRHTLDIVFDGLRPHM